MSGLPKSCRLALTNQDLQFIAETLGDSGNENAVWSLMVQDPDCLDKMLDDRRVFRSLLEMQGCLKVSAALYFYVLVRQALLSENCDDKKIADYVAGILQAAMLQGGSGSPAMADGHPVEYLFDMLAIEEKLEGVARFQFQIQVGDLALYLSGFFPRSIEARRHRRGAPGFAFFEELGSSHYLTAGHHARAASIGLMPLLLTLGGAFHTARLALNRLSDEWVCWRSPDSVERLFSLIEPGGKGI